MLVLLLIFFLCQRKFSYFRQVNTSSLADAFTSAIMALLVFNVVVIAHIIFYFLIKHIYIIIIFIVFVDKNHSFSIAIIVIMNNFNVTMICKII